MCPYCGEEVPDDSARCWKCGTELGDGGAPARGEDDELEVPDEDGGGEKKVELVACPFCDSPMPKSALRCKECGRTVRDPETPRGAVAWKLGPWVAFAAVALVALAIVGIVIRSRLQSREIKGERIAIDFRDLEKRVPPGASNAQRRQQVWEEHYEGKIVSWTHWVLKVQKNDQGQLEAWFLADEVDAKTAKDKKPATIVTFADDDDIKDLKPAEKFPYTARLVGLGGRATFTLESGQKTKQP